MTEPSHQVVVQFPEAAVPDFDTLARSEDLLVALLGDQHVYDGLHIGCGTANFYILTADRAAVLIAIQGGSGWLAHPDCRIAARRLDADAGDFRVLWPQGDSRDFHLSYGEGEGTGPAWRSRRPGGPSATSGSEALEPLPAFLPLTEGRVPGTRFQHRVHHLGQLRLASGRLESCDPFVNLGKGLVVDVPPGDYHVYVTLADVSKDQDWSNIREAYLSVVLHEAAWTTSSFLTPVGWAPPTGDVYYGVPVDSATVCFVDAGAVASSMPDTGRNFDGWLDEVFDTERDESWFALIDSPDHLIPGCANIVMPRARAGENVVLCRSGWGDGFYPVVGTYDAQGQLVGVHIDLQVDETPGERTS